MSATTDGKLLEARESLKGIKKEDNPVLFEVMQEILAEDDGSGQAFADAFRSGTENGSFTSHWSHSSGLVTERPATSKDSAEEDS